MPRRVFIAGDRGQMALALARTYSARGAVVRSAGRAALDIGDDARVRSALIDFRPDLVVNAAAYTAVDKAEDAAGEAFRVNRDGAHHIAAAAQEVGAPLIHISTDYVFDGVKPTPYAETDSTNPLGIYGQSKLAGEIAVMAECMNYAIVRTSWIFSADGHNFVKTILRLAGERDAIDVVDDQWGAPTFAADLAGAIAAIGESLLCATAQPAPRGIYHVSGSGYATWYGFARAIIKLSTEKGGPSCELRPIATDGYPTRARRPANSCLDGAKALQIFGVRLPDWQASLSCCLDQLIVVPRGANP
jgi:dTDP-4-dehydrorhamnose reductase